MDIQSFYNTYPDLLQLCQLYCDNRLELLQSLLRFVMLSKIPKNYTKIIAFYVNCMEKIQLFRKDTFDNIKADYYGITRRLWGMLTTCMRHRFLYLYTSSIKYYD